MSNSKRALVALFALSLCTVVPRAWADTAATPASPAEEVVKLWPGQPPGTEDWSKPEKATDMHVPDAGRVVHVINNVTQPTLTIVRPAAGRATGAGVIVLPGGGFGALAWDLEGTEVARWLADRGITAFVLKYRVHDQDPSMMPQIAKVLANPSTEVRFEEFMKLLEPRRQIAVADAVQADDTKAEQDGVTLVVDPISLDLVRGSTVDFVESLGGSAFQVTNPNAASGCGCGTSFSI